MATDELESILTLPETRGLAADITARLRTAILGGHFGPGERLLEESLARSLGVSRGPVREALSRLERQGLVVIRPNRGAMVAQLSREDLDEVYSLRVAIERLAVQRAIRYAEPAHLEEMQALVDAMAASERSMTEQEAAELDLRFHEVIYRASNHQRLLDCWTDLRPQIHILLLSRNVAHPDFRDFAVTGHQGILDALRDRDQPLAVTMIEEHLAVAYDRVTAAFAQRAPAETGALTHAE